MNPPPNYPQECPVLDPEGPYQHQQFTPEEVKKLRVLLNDAEHATWLRKQIFVVVPVVFAIVSALVAAFNWVANNLTWKHP